MFQAVSFGDNDDAVVGEGQAAAAVEVQDVADFHAGWDFDPFVDDVPHRLIRKESNLRRARGATSLFAVTARGMRRLQATFAMNVMETCDQCANHFCLGCLTSPPGTYPLV